MGGFIRIAVLLCAGTLNLTELVEAQGGEGIWYIFPMLPMFGLFFVSALAETNRPPIDLPEAEAELVAGYNVEYSSFGFALFFLEQLSRDIVLIRECVEIEKFFYLFFWDEFYL